MNPGERLYIDLAERDFGHAHNYLWEAQEICEALRDKYEEIESMAEALSKVASIYVIGLGGSLANAIHFASDLRNLCRIKAYTPNICEMTARMNDDGMDSAFLTRAGSEDALFVLSVGGGTDTVSTGISTIVKRARTSKAKIFGIVGPNGGITAELGDHVIKIPVTNKKRITPHAEAFQSVICHLLVSHPLLQVGKTKW